MDSAAVRSTAGLAAGTQLNVRDIQNAIKALYATGQFDDVQIICRVAPAADKATLVIQVRERPLQGRRLTGCRNANGSRV